MPSRRTMSSNPAPPPSPPLPPPRPPLRSRRKSKSPPSRSTPKRPLDVDTIVVDGRPRSPPRRGPRDPRGSRGSELDRKWEGVASELRFRGSRMRSAVYQTSEAPSMVKSKRRAERSESRGGAERSDGKATFV
ncbi:hypothetical protein EYF80_065773 [Liparis tanakae]|uniref:Uncharacterized protein n=1 Tax=Liparis tanakae TaxID=230148 RepID=A0A4Z2E666_9TELE|nr:hypothetical protein EYF80_065773 [Liparis tanakae]